MKLLSGVFLICAVFCCQRASSQKVADLKIEGIKVTKVVVSSQGKVAEEMNKAIATITDPAQISRLTEFCAGRLKEKRWLPESDGFTMAHRPPVYLVFYDGDQGKYNFGIGQKFFSTVDGAGYTWTRADAKEIEKFLSLIGIDSKYLLY
ncbi:MAG TPA: hypothetical protein VFD58_12330 [Blastocatellia bacterium]|nr:hypothetical protein [Blastocatellia bacterium]